MNKCLIRVVVRAGARSEAVIEKGGRIEVSVREPAERNAANQRARTLLARYLRVPERSVRLVSGHRRAQKTFEVIE